MIPFTCVPQAQMSTQRKAIFIHRLRNILTSPYYRQEWQPTHLSARSFAVCSNVSTAEERRVMFTFWFSWWNWLILNFSDASCSLVIVASSPWVAYIIRSYALVITRGPFFVAYQNLPGRCLVCKHGSHVINIPKADWSSVKNKQLTATPC